METAKTLDDARKWYFRDGRKTYAVSGALMDGRLVFSVDPFADWADLRAYLVRAMRMNSFVTLEKRPDFAFEGYTRLEVRW